MNIKTLLLTGGVMACVSPMMSQRVMSAHNMLRDCGINIDGRDITGIRNLVDGSDKTLCSIENATGAEIIFTLQQPCVAKAVGIVAGPDLDKTPSRMTLYGRNSESEDWKTVGRFTTGITFDHPYGAFFGKSLSSAKSYSSYKLEISRMNGQSTLELAEIQILGIPSANGIISGGSYTASDNATNLHAADGSNLSSPVTFRNARGDYGTPGCWIQYSLPEAVAATGYSVVTSPLSGASSRPTAWELLGSTDGETWHTLDMHSNAANINADSYAVTRRFATPDHYIDFAAAADELHEMLAAKFLRNWGSGGGKYLIHSWNENLEKVNTGYNYWWMAHAIDAYVDAFARTSSTEYFSRARQIRQGMYTAYDPSRQDLWNSFFDDMEWMNLACIRAYENFKIDRSKWLEEAIQLFDWIWNEGWNEDNGTEGGIRWNHGEDGKGKNSCSNAPAIIGAAKLYQITGEEQYLKKATMIFDWMLTHSRFEDGFIKDAPSNDNRGWAFSYNQGTWVGGLLELYRITHDSKYYDIATDLIDKSIDSRWYSPDGIMREQGSGDGGLFKGIYIRYITSWVLSGFLDEERQYRYARYIAENARSMYDSALIKPDMKVMPDWKSRSEISNGENNGGKDGNYDASIALSGIFLFESMDMMRRSGILTNDYHVKCPAAEKKYSHFRLALTDNVSADDIQIGAFTVTGAEDSSSSVAATRIENGIRIIPRSGSVEFQAPEGSLAHLFSVEGICLRPDISCPGTIGCDKGIYIARVNAPTETITRKIQVR